MRLLLGDDAVLDTDRRQLARSGDPVTLSPKAYRLLELLARSRPKALSKADIQEALWPKTFVADSNLRALVNEVRDAIGDDAQRPRYIRTVYGFGYAFSGEASPAPARRGPAPEVVHRVKWAGEEVQLAEGESVLGRDEAATVWVGDDSVSRRHARVVVSGETAVLEDLGSKNGTFRGGERVLSPVPLESGDEIRLGSVRLRYQRVSPRASTRTKRSGSTP